LPLGALGFSGGVSSMQTQFVETRAVSDKPFQIELGDLAGIDNVDRCATATSGHTQAIIACGCNKPYPKDTK